MLVHSGTDWADDSYQYVATAGDLLRFGKIETPLVYFDTERAHGTLPAPLTTFPPGYPILIATLARFGLSLPRAALAISMGSYFVTLLLSVWAANLLRLGPMMARLLIACILFNEYSLRFAISILTESLFTAIVLGAAVALLAARGPFSSVLAGFLVGASFWVRYAGLFIVLGAGLFFVLSWILARRRDFAHGLITMGIASLMTGSIMLRNFLLTGTWKGGNTKHAFHPVPAVLKAFFVSVYHVVFGNGPTGRIGILVFTFCAIAVALACLLYFRGHPIHQDSRQAYLLLGTVVITYMAGITYMGIFSVISFGPRMLYPVIPELFLLLCMYLSPWDWDFAAHAAKEARLWKIGLVAATVAYVISNAMVVRYHPVPSHQQVLAAFNKADEKGVPLIDSLDRIVLRDQPLFASNPQATGYALDRKTLGLSESSTSDAVWNEKSVRESMQRFGIRYLVLYPGMDLRAGRVQEDSSFLRGVLRGELPSWLSLAASNGAVRIYQRNFTPDRQY